MNNQEVYSLAIQALHERRSMLQHAIDRRHRSSIVLKLYPGAIKECEEAIRKLEEVKHIDELMNEVPSCVVTVEIKPTES